MKNQFAELPIATRVGQFIAHYSEKGLAGLDFPNAVSRTGQRHVSSAKNEISAQIHDWHRTTESALQAVLAGSKPKKLPPLDPAGTTFQQAVWRELKKIPVGRTKSYGEIAKRIGKPKAVQAVGGACGANPIPVLVPCHRVLAANKKLGGFSGGLDWKRKLLAAEGIGL
jgi:O-6-methylguanine DNA methyltransferase